MQQGIVRKRGISRGLGTIGTNLFRRVWEFCLGRVWVLHLEMYGRELGIGI